MADYSDRAALWTKDPPPVSLSPVSLSPVSWRRSWLLAAVPVLAVIVLVVVLGVLHAQVTGQLWTVEQKVSNLTAVIQSLNSSLQHRQDVQQLKESVDKNQQQLNSVVDALQQLNEVESLKKSIMALKCALQHLTSNSSADGCCPLGWVQFENDCFFFSTLSLSWNESQVWCEQHQAHLVLLHSDKAWDFVKLRAAPTFFWVGLSDWRTGRWEWVNQTPYTMQRRHWVPGQPDNWFVRGLGHEDCAHLHSDGRLNDLHCSTRMHYICQQHSSRG
ncbi:uncharacterized protein V6R79_003187 [Siganus canaliculatus]